jgi:lipid II:glycine glycyltransferase (peptidoglycan interpeptide bridge formation enzyme)
MHPKTRYNIKVALRHKIEITQDNSDEAFETYLKLTKETTRRQEFYAHDEQYHRLMWQTLKATSETSRLTAHLFLAKYKGQTLAAWILFTYKDTLYYPYGASSTSHRETMASNLLMWETIKFGRKLGLKKFDMWGALGPNPDKNDPWFGFHKFKQGYGPKLVEFIGSFDLVIYPMLYEIYKILDKIRWAMLKLKK